MLFRSIEVTFVGLDGVATLNISTVDAGVRVHNVVRDHCAQAGWNNHGADLGIVTLFSHSDQLLIQHRLESLVGVCAGVELATITVDYQVTHIGYGTVSAFVVGVGCDVGNSSTAGVETVCASESVQRTHATAFSLVCGWADGCAALAAVFGADLVSTHQLHFHIEHEFDQLLDFLILNHSKWIRSFHFRLFRLLYISIQSRLSHNPSTVSIRIPRTSDPLVLLPFGIVVTPSSFDAWHGIVFNLTW